MVRVAVEIWSAAVDQSGEPAPASRTLRASAWPWVERVEVSTTTWTSSSQARGVNAGRRTAYPASGKNRAFGGRAVGAAGQDEVGDRAGQPFAASSCRRGSAVSPYAESPIAGRSPLGASRTAPKAGHGPEDLQLLGREPVSVLPRPWSAA